MEWFLALLGYDGTQTYGFELAYLIYLALTLFDLIYITKLDVPVDDITDEELDKMLLYSKIRFFVGIALGFAFSFLGVACAWVTAFAFEIIFTVDEEAKEATQDSNGEK